MRRITVDGALQNASSYLRLDCKLDTKFNLKFKILKKVIMYFVLYGPRFVVSEDWITMKQM